MLRISLALFTLALVAQMATAADSYWVYFGGYTGGKSGGKGIMVASMDAKTGRLTKPEVAVEVGSPSFLAIAPSGKTLYAVGEGGGGKDGAPVYAFRIDPATGLLTKLNQLGSGGSGACHVATDKAGKFAVVSNYGSGSMAVFSLNDDGSLKARTAFVQHMGKSINKGNQEGPHAHCGAFDQTGEFVLVADLGIDKVLIYKLDRATGAVTPHTTPFIALPPGSGPRHFEIDPANNLLFVCGEINSTVNAVTLDLAGDKTAVTQSLSTLPQPTRGNSTAECRIHPSGKFVYVSNRGHNSIAAFKNDGGKLTAIGHATEGIKVPRNFNIEPGGKWMLVASQDGDNVAVFSIGDDGVPKPTGVKVATPAPVCVKFLAK